ncbi:hypothetical protein PFICI_09007 [Pestalotiopsis fici W106-1]|uniref:Integral membrane protein n=1 Tax=Pestalotiopsis fici (strain W106-1 / CGMCC3.15140) TaxID=1229662 RepID=W3WZD6_PESFW|nr:uncharacterized protein PFICI_09007 [Pestalotiopsis fici W106-1]ETS79154.1 hypothetical protein PFICI_09007 [Pestalotiopsis fici W106-1]
MTSPLQPRPSTARQRWDKDVPTLLRPLVRAYILGYATTVTPRLITLVLRQYVTTKKARKARGSSGADSSGPSSSQQPALSTPLLHILRGGLELQRFPTFCALLVGGSSLLEFPLSAIISRLASRLKPLARQRLARFLSAFCAAWYSLKLLQSKHSDAFTERATVQSDDAQPHRLVEDLTLFALTRALDVIVGELWDRRHRTKRRPWAQLDTAISKLTDPSIFALSCGFIMWSWFYYPSRLPRAYSQWISTAAAVDARLIEALRRCRKGEIRYGEDTGQAPLLEAMARDYGWPVEWGDPAKTAPYPCEMVHMGCGPSCEYHFISRFARSFKWSMTTYLPLNLLLVARSPRLKAFKKALVSASRSSAFLAAFITLFFYGVCLARTRVGPHLIGKDAASRTKIDAGICVGTGCFLCGWSILLEAAGRRKDIALFVAPRAMATLLPRRYHLDKQWRETLVFSLSTAVVFTCVLENQTRVRGVLGKVLATVLVP